MSLSDWIEENRDTLNFMMAVVILLGIVVIFSYLKVYFQGGGEVVATVNGEKIYKSQLDARYDSLSPRMQQSYTRGMMLQQLIQEMLLLQRIEELGIEASEEEVDQKLQEFLDSRGLSREQLNQILKSQGMDEERLRSQMENQVLLEKLLEQEAYAGLNVSREEARRYYNNNLEQFKTERAARIEQVLLSNGTRQEARSLARQLREAAPEDFCGFIANRSPELQKMCGPVNITRRSGLPGSFVNKSFNLRQEEIGIAESPYGYHVIKKIGTRKAQVESFRSVENQIKESLRSRQKKRAYREYLRKLRSNATIENKLLDELIRNVTQPEEKTGKERVQCIAENSTLYGAGWNTETQKQLKLFGNQSDSIDYVECSVKGNFEKQTEACEAKDIGAYPTWIINGQKHTGFQSVKRLAEITGCK